MGVLSNISNLLSSATPQHIASSAVNYGERALQAVRQTATQVVNEVGQTTVQVRDHFTHGNGHTLDNILRNTGNDVVQAGRDVGGNIGSNFGGAVGGVVGTLFTGGLGTQAASDVGQARGGAAGEAIGQEVAALIVDGGTGLIQDVASVIPGLARRGGERHIPNHPSVIEGGLASLAEGIMSPFMPEHRPLTPQQRQALHDNSVAVSLDNPEATAAHNARLAERRAQQSI